MKLNTQKRNVLTGSVKESTEFTINLDAAAYKILSDGIYSDKVLAVIRELSCNAYDSHIQAGKENIPFEVTLPSALNPQFIVKDFGVGLSHKDIMSLYTTYFGSNKRDTNTVVGAFGVGSKSPFAYTDTFTVQSTFDGVTRTYVAMLGEKGIPNINLLDTTETGLGNGMEVSIAVQQKDFIEFREKAEKIYKWFSPLPKIKGAKGLNLDRPKMIIGGTGWRFVKNDHSYYRNRNNYAIQGVVAYNLSLETAGVSKNIISAFEGMELELEFKIGELDVATSREELSYTAHTCKSIVKRLTLLMKELDVEIKKDFDKCTTMWEMVLKFRELDLDSSYHGLGRYIHNIPNFFINLNGKKITKFRIKYNKENGDPKLTYYQSHRTKGSILSGNMNSITPAKTEVFVCDIKTGWVSSINDYLEKTNNVDNIILLDSDNNLQSVIGRLGNPPVRYMSEIYVAVPRKPRNKKGTVYSKDIMFHTVDIHMTNRGDHNVGWKASKFAPVDGQEILYVPMKYSTASLNGNKLDPYYWSRIYQRLVQGAEELGIKPKFSDIYGIRTCDLADAKKVFKLVNAFDYIENLWDTINTSKEANQISDYLHFKGQRTYDLNFSFPLEDWDKELTAPHAMLKQVKANDYYNKLSNTRAVRVYYIMELLNAGRIHKEFKMTGKPTYDVETMRDSIYKKYPLLAQIGQSAEFKDIINYIKLIDKK